MIFSIDANSSGLVDLNSQTGLFAGEIQIEAAQFSISSCELSSTRNPLKVIFKLLISQCNFVHGVD